MKLIVIGHGMVGHKFLETLYADAGAGVGRPGFDVTVLCEEPRPAYDRVHLSEFFAGRSADALSLVAPGFFERFQDRLALKLNAKAVAVDRAAKTVTLGSGEVLGYDKLVFASGSSPFVPPVPGRERAGCFV
jgi:nitrite reductase (NADH) large subunit